MKYVIERDYARSSLRTCSNVPC